MSEINEMWHYQNWATLNDKLYKESLSHENFFDDGRIHHQDKYVSIASTDSFDWYPQDGEDRYFVKMVKGNEFFILPRKYLSKLPINIKGETKKVKLKPSESQVWNFITGVDSMKQPEKMFFSFRDTIDVFNPVKHSDEKSWTFLKLFSFTTGIKCGICGPVGCGKNANLTVLRHIRGNVILHGRKRAQFS